MPPWSSDYAEATEERLSAIRKPITLADKLDVLRTLVTHGFIA